MRNAKAMRLVSFVAVVAGVVLSACNRDTPLSVHPRNAPLASAGQVQAEETLDEEFARLASEVPGFAGMFVDGTGQLSIALTPAAAREQAESRLAVSIQARRQRLVERGLSGAIVFRSARYKLFGTLDLARAHFLAFGAYTWNRVARCG